MKRSQHNAVSDQQTELRNTPERRPKPADVSVWHPRIGSMLPPGWKVTTLGEVVRPTRPRVSPHYYPSLPFIGMEHVEAHSMRLLRTIPAGQMKSSAVHFQAGDVLYGRLRPYLNKVYLPDFEGLCSAEFIVFPAMEALDPKYLQYLLNSAAFVSFASHLNTGDRPRVDFDQLASYEIPIASLAEQRRIVAEIEKQFTRLEAAVAALKRVQANLKRYRASVLKAACEGRLVPTEAELARAENRPYEPADKLLARILKERRARWEADQLAKMHAAGKPPKDNKWKAKYKEPAPPDTSGVPKLPEGWVWTNVGQLCSVGTGATPKRGESLYYEAGSIPWVTSASVNEQFVRDPSEYVTEKALSETNLTVFPAHTLLVAMYGEGRTRGKISELLIRATTNQALAGLVTQGLEAECRAYLKIHLNGNYEAIRRKSSGGVQPNLNLDLVRQIALALPSLAGQRRITAEVERRLSVIDELEATVEANLKRAAGLRQSILKRAFEGKLVPQDPSDEPASVLLERIRNAKPHESVVHSDSSVRGKAKKRGRNSARHS